MSQSYYPASLPYIAALHDEDALNKLIESLSKEDEASKPGVVNPKNEKSHPFIDTLHKMDDFIKGKDMIRTDNGAIAHSTTHDACLDLFHVLGGVEKHKLKLLDEAWKQDRDLTLHIIFYARSIHLGQNRKFLFYRAFCWLLRKHPKTAIRNLFMLVHGTIKSGVKQENPRKSELGDGEDWVTLDEMIAEDLTMLKSHGYWKDLAVILTIYCQGELQAPVYNTYKATHWGRTHRQVSPEQRKMKTKMRRKARSKMSEEDRIQDVQHNIELSREKGEKEKAQAHEKRVHLRKERNERVSYLLTNDKVYQALHATVSRLFADQLLLDMSQLEVNKNSVEAGLDKRKYALSNHLSLAAKWAPSLRHSFDKHTLLATSIAEIMFPPSKYQDKDETREHYIQKVRELYRKQCLVPLREALDLTECRMSSGQWEAIDYRHVPSTCLRQNINHFVKHTPDRVLNYLKLVQEGKKKLNGSTLTPNQLVYSAFDPDIPESFKDNANYSKIMNDVINGQWNSMLDSIRNTGLNDANGKGKVGLSNCIAVCDVSGSMFELRSKTKRDEVPIYAAIGLSLVISNLAKPPFNGHIISFTNRPSLITASTDLPFSEQVNVVKNSHVGYSTNLNAVFTDLLLPMAKKYNLRREDMVKRIFIFSDMEFDSSEARSKEFLTTYEVIREEYIRTGYDVPELVWWNLSGKATIKAPVTKEHEGVCLLSGFSASMVKVFLEGELEEKSEEMDEFSEGTNNEKATGDRMNPINIMKKSVYHESFRGLKVFD